MESVTLLLIMFGVSICCLAVERQVAWFFHINGICLIIISALVLSAVGLIPNQHAVYDLALSQSVPIAITLLILSLDIKELLALPRTFIVVLVVGVMASICGALVAAYIGALEMGHAAAQLAAQLGASYIGGGENAVAIQRMLSIPHELFVGAFAVDNVVTSLWMIVAILYAGPRFHGADVPSPTSAPAQRIAPNIFEILIIAFLVTLIILLAEFLAQAVGGLHTLLYISILAALIGQIPMIRRYIRFSYTLGVVLFIPFFFSIGAISNFAALAALPWAVVYMPLLVVGIHGLLIFSIGKVLRVPNHYVAVASQVMIGGPSTAVAVAQAKNWRGGIAVAVVAGIFGYAIANFVGMFIYHVAQHLTM